MTHRSPLSSFVLAPGLAFWCLVDDLRREFRADLSKVTSALLLHAEAADTPHPPLTLLPRAEEGRGSAPDLALTPG